MGNLRQQADDARLEANKLLAAAHEALDRAADLERRAIEESDELVTAAESEVEADDEL